jgi:hypothetical protein
VVALERFDQAGPANPAAVDDAAERFARLSADAEPADPVLRAYAGATTSMRAGTTMLPWRKMTLHRGRAGPGRQGAGAAGQRARTAAAPRRARGAGSALRGGQHLPRPAGRCSTASERGRQQLDQVLGSPLLDSAPLPFRAVVWLRAARLAEDDKQPARPASGTNAWWPATRRRPQGPRATG